MSSGGGGAVGTATTATTSFRTILEKPLNQLTEDDISQLTREDCRNYLKEKGMRRPSWNKSQAIQQVISLKALLEPNDESSATILRKLAGPSPPPPPHAAAARVASNSTNSAKEAGETVAPPQLKKEELQKPAVKVATTSKNQCAPDASVRQMTIFYCGKVNVYDGMPPDKARTIMTLAARPNHLPLDNHLASPRSLRCQFQNLGDNDGPFTPNATIPQAVQAESQASRNVSLQRYREKRKHREQVKTKKNMGPTSSLEVYLNPQFRRHPSNGDSSRSSTGSPPEQPGLLHIADNQIRCLPVDLNENEIMEC